MSHARGLRDVQTWGMLPTPFTSDGADVDHASLAGLGHHLVNEGCEGLVCLGMIAEPSTLNVQEQVAIIDTLTTSSLDVPIVASLMTTDERAALRTAATLVSEFGDVVTGLMVPVHSSDALALRAHLQRLHQTTGTDLLVQDLPRATGVTIEVDDLAQALDGLGFVVGVKCESPPTFHRIRRLAANADYSLISGLGGAGLIDDLLAGADAVAIGSTATAAIASAFAAWRLGHRESARDLIAAVSPLLHFETQPGQSTSIRKEHWRRRGLIASATVRPPTPTWTRDLDAHARIHGYEDAAES